MTELDLSITFAIEDNDHFYRIKRQGHNFKGNVRQIGRQIQKLCRYLDIPSNRAYEIESFIVRKYLKWNQEQKKEMKNENR
jgi:hypothetical protein